VTPIPLPQPPLGDGVVRVRPWRADDLAARVEAWRDADLMRFMLQPAPEPITVEAARAWLEARERRRLAGEALFLVVAEPDSDRAVGAVWLWNVSTADRRGEIGYWLLRPARGRGYATRAVELLCRYAFEQLGLARLELFTMPENLASIRLAQRTGFRRERPLRAHRPAGPLRVDLAVFARLAEPQSESRPASGARPSVTGAATPDRATEERAAPPERGPQADGARASPRP
jgi:[ribosomal protein S5]-alanine N-acetyltransferase